MCIYTGKKIKRRKCDKGSWSLAPEQQSCYLLRLTYEFLQYDITLYRSGITNISDIKGLTKRSLFIAYPSSVHNACGFVTGYEVVAKRNLIKVTRNVVMPYSRLFRPGAIYQREKITTTVPGKTIEDIKKHYEVISSFRKIKTRK